MSRTIQTSRWLAILVAASAVACSGNKDKGPGIETATVSRRDIVVTAQATGTVEPIDTVAVKSQASGLIIAMPVEVGTQVKPGDLIAQIDKRNLNNDYQRAVAAEAAAKATLTVDKAALERANQLYAQKVITADEHEAAVVAEANAESQLTSTQTNLRTAQQNLEYATVRAEVAGTVISKSATVGSVVASAVSTFGGGSTIVTVANLQRVRMRALVNETDVGNVHPGMPVSVTIEAFPNRQFNGTVEKVEPQAVIQQSVTMFPVLVSLDNVDQALLPGMNGEVSIITQQRRNVVAIPNDAVRSMRDLPIAAAALGVNRDSVEALMRAGRSGRRTGTHAGSTGTAGAVAVSDAMCAKVSAALSDTSSARTQIMSLREQRMSGAIDSTTMRTRMQAIYKQLGISPDSARACMMKARAARGGAGARAGGMRTAGGTGMFAGSGGAQIVFVKQGTSWVPHRVRLGVSDFDYSEVLSGLEDGDVVALLGAAVMQAQRDQASDRAKAMTGGGLPGTGSTTSTRTSTRGGNR